MSDNVNHPAHYTDHCSVECIDMIRLALGDDGFRAYCLGNAIKYLWRYKNKNGKEDINKACVYLDWLGNMEDEELTRWSKKLTVVRDMFRKALESFYGEETE